MSLTETIRRIIREDTQNKDNNWNTTIEGEDVGGSAIALVQYAEKYPTKKVDLEDLPAGSTEKMKSDDSKDHLKLKERDPKQDAELEYPIVLVQLRNGRLKVLDGKEEIKKAKELNKKTIRVKILPSEDVIGKFGDQKGD